MKNRYVLALAIAMGTCSINAQPVNRNGELLAAPEYEAGGVSRIADSDSALDRVVRGAVELVDRADAIPEPPAVPPTEYASPDPFGRSQPLTDELRARLYREIVRFRDRSNLAYQTAESFVAYGQRYLTAARSAQARDEALNNALLLEDEAKSRLRALVATLESRESSVGRLDGTMSGYQARAQALDAPVDRWWQALVALRATLAEFLPDFHEQSYPPAQYLALGWHRSSTGLQLDAGIPEIASAEIESRISQEQIATTALSHYLDSEIEAHEAAQAHRFVVARHLHGRPKCEGDERCIGMLDAELVRAEGRLVRATAIATARRESSELALSRTRGVPEFLAHLDIQQDALHRDVNDHLAELGAFRDDRARAVADAYAACLALEAHLGISIPRCHPGLAVRENVLAPNQVVSPVSRTGPREHVFILFNHRLPVPTDFAAFTYVVFPARLNDQWPDREERYRRLLAVIVDRTAGAASARLSASELNVFAIPSTITCESNGPMACYGARSDSRNAANLECDDTGTEEPARPCYHEELGLGLNSLLNSGDLLRPDLQESIAGNQGPFLITTYQPIHLGASSQEQQAEATQPVVLNQRVYLPLMLVDLSDYQAGSFERIVDAYKNAIIDSPPEGQVLWSPPLKERIYGAIYTAGEVTSVVQTRVSELLASLGI